MNAGSRGSPLVVGTASEIEADQADAALSVNRASSTLIFRLEFYGCSCLKTRWSSTPRSRPSPARGNVRWDATSRAGRSPEALCLLPWTGYLLCAKEAASALLVVEARVGAPQRDQHDVHDGVFALRNPKGMFRAALFAPGSHDVVMHFGDAAIVQDLSQRSVLSAFITIRRFVESSA